jgi:hypothetical protein
MSAIEDDELTSIRRSSTYRTGIWSARVANLGMLPVVVWGAASVANLAPAPPTPVFLAAWAVGFVGLASAFWLFHRSGVPFQRRGLTWVADERMGDVILRDVFMVRP